LLALFALAPVAFVAVMVVDRRWVNGNRDWLTLLIAVSSFAV